MQSRLVTRDYFRWLIFFLLGSTIFALTYGQAPLYFSNQNQYFLHGLAEGGYGSLDRDWLANTEDTTPLFALLVAATWRYLGEWPFYVYYALLMGIYLASLVGLFEVIVKERTTLLARVIFIALLLLIHSALVRSLSAQWLGVDYPWYFQAGVAGQYVLGPMLQPSTFGVLLLPSINLFARGRPFLAVTCSSLAGVCHSTYLLPAAILTISYLVVLLREHPILRAFLVGAWALALVLPTVVYNLIHFRPTSPETFAIAQEILVHFRIPHHTLPQLWFDSIAAVQVAWIILGIALAWQTRLFPVLTITFVLSVILTIVQVMTANDTLALLFPWRISVILVPVATTIILTRLVIVITSRKEPASRFAGAAWVASMLIIAVVTISGIAIMTLGLAYQERDEELAMMEFVHDHKSPGDLYLLPVPIPNLKATVRGSFKSDFKPLPTLQKNTQFIPVNLQRFRLNTGVPIYVDFKSIPYKDVEVLEWKERLLFNQEIFDGLKKGKEEQVVSELRQRGITHIVVPAEEKFHSPHLVQVFQDAYYRIYRLNST